MLATALIAVISMRAPVQMVQCIDVPQGQNAASFEARGKDWFMKGEALTIGGRRYARSGPPIGMAPSDVVPLEAYKGAMTYAQIGKAPGVIYVLADIRDCTFQAYRAAR
jgi:hypothetical protein